MGKREQKGQLFNRYGGWHVRYWVAYNDLTADEKEKIKTKYAAKQQDPPSRVQKSKRTPKYDS